MLYRVVWLKKKEKVTDTLRREFQEEVLNFPDLDEFNKEKLLSTIKNIFENGGSRVYCGYVDDPRNTDNSWMETTAYNFHDENHEHLALIEWFKLVVMQLVLFGKIWILKCHYLQVMLIFYDVLLILIKHIGEKLIV